jgi:hypothetical protein
VNRDAEALRHSNIVLTSNIVTFGIQLFGKRRLEIFRAWSCIKMMELPPLEECGSAQLSVTTDWDLQRQRELGCGSRKAVNEYVDRKRNKKWAEVQNVTRLPGISAPYWLSCATVSYAVMRARTRS